MSRKKYVLVVNLKSRKSRLTIDKFIKEFENRKEKIEILKVKDPKNLKSNFRKALAMKPDVIVLGGGDGTLISGIEYLAKKGYDKDIGLLPLGTANYLARNLNIPLTVSESVETLLTGKVREIPMGIANDKYFALAFVMGLTQAVSDNVSDQLKRKIGQIAYIYELIKQSKIHEPFEYEITSPNLKRPIKGVTHQIVVYNSDLNQQVKLVPDHDLAKSTLKVVVSSSGPYIHRLFVGFLTHILTAGKKRPYMKVFEASSLKILTRPSLTADYDGEVYGKSPFDIKICEKKIRVIAK
jgi:YegS/Rv2252/BmrU family lipid kinase